MVISRENRYIFIAVPKTGTTSIEKLLTKYDPSARRFGITIDGKEYSFKGHGTALHIKKELGDQYSNFRTFGFVRNPYSRLVSSYYFYKKGGKQSEERRKTKVIRELKIQSAKLVPFKLWTLMYPYKSNREYFVDENNNIIVDYIGTFENLLEDLTKIFSSINLDIPINELSHTNKTNHSSFKEYFTDELFTEMVNRSIEKDLRFYKDYKFNL